MRSYRTEQRSRLHGLFEVGSRRFLSALCGFYLLGTILFSSLFVIVEADHDCEGHDCPTCLQLQTSLNGLQETGTPLATDAQLVASEIDLPARTTRVDYRAPALTLRSLDVCWDE